MKKHSRESTSTGATVDEAARDLELAEKFGLTKAEVEAVFEQLERAGDMQNRTLSRGTTGLCHDRKGQDRGRA